MLRFSAIMLALLLTACGFTLDKPVENHMPDTLALATQQADEFESVLQQTFKYQGILLTTNSTTPPLALVIKKQQEYERYVGSSSVTLTIEVTALISNREGKTIIFPETFVKEATVQFNANDDANKRLMIASQRTQLFTAIAGDIYDFLATQNLDNQSP